MADVKLLASQRLTDNPDGGGLMTNTEIVDGVVNNLWPDISRIDRGFGVVNLRKVYCKADTPDTAIYSGLHLIVLFPPQDPRVTITMFTTNNWADVRSDAQSAVERYLDESVVTRMIPFDRQLAGGRTILVFQRPELDLPEIGQVYVIADLPNELNPQFVRVSNVEQSVQTFTDPSFSGGMDFKARVVTLTLTEPLQRTYQGSQPTKLFAAAVNTSIIRKSIVSDAVNYHTVHALAHDAAIGDQTVKIDSIFTQLVPASTTESRLANLPPGGARTNIPSGSSFDMQLLPNGNLLWIAGSVFYLPCAAIPGTVTLYQHLGASLYDDGVGNLHLVSPTGAVQATIEYESGLVSVVNNTTLSNSEPGHAVFVPAAAVSKIASTFQQRVTTSTRGYVYVATLHPTPQPGSLSVSYRALGRWYTLTDDGSGALVGDVGIGIGSISFSSGTASVSLGALPDIGSSIIWSWGGSSEYEIKTGDVTVGNPVIRATMPGNNIKPSTMTVTWTAGGIGKTATDNGAGSFTGDATGHLVYGNGTLALKPTLLPDPTTTFAFAYQNSAIRTELFNPSLSGSTITMTVAHGPIRPKSVLITYQQTIPGLIFGANWTTVEQLTDDGSGNLVDALGNIKAGSIVNYTTGAITFNPDFTAPQPTLDYASFENQVPARLADPDSGYFSTIARPALWPIGATVGNHTIGFVNGTNVTVQYKEDTATDTVQPTYSLPAPPISVDLTPAVSSPIVPGGVLFTLGGRTYVERAGSLYYNVDPLTNAGSLGGSVDYTTGQATITSWVGGASSTLSLEGLLTEVNPLPTVILNGRTPGSPLRPESFYIQANKLDGTLISTTADVDGKIATSNMHGYVDVTTGVYSVAFGQYVLDSSLTPTQKAQPWYDPSGVDGDGYFLVPDPVEANSIRYNAVVEVSLPLDSTILGIDPVRLPLDGRVQAVRAGYMLVLHDTQVTTLPGGLTAGQVITLPRNALALVEVRDQTGTMVPGEIAGGPTVTGAKYSVNLATGAITMATPLDLSAYTQPLVATHRIEDASVVTDVQITGQVTVAEALAHAYTAANSLASTALIAPFVGGSVQAAVNHLFSQQTWDSAHPNWTDAVIGSGTTAAFDALNYPIQVLNRDAITEKWALIFTSSTAFNVVAQDLGVIATGNTSTDILINNPATGNPYFFLDHRGFGLGWATGNAIRFDTQGAGFPAWLARTVRTGPATYTDDRDVVESRWDKS